MKSKRVKVSVLIAAVVLVAAVLAVVLGLTVFNSANSQPTDPTDTSGTNSSEPSATSDTEPQVTEPVELPPDTATKTLDPLDEVGPWIGSSPAVRSDGERTWLVGEERDEQGSVVLSRVFDPALDLRGYADGYLHLWVYVEDISKMSGGQVELSSSGNPDNRELSWDLLLYIKRSGWNELYLPFDKASRVGGEIDLKNVNFMRIFGIVEDGCEFGADEIAVTNEEPPEESHLDSKNQFVLDEVESLGAWIGTAPVFRSGNAPVGTGYVYTDTLDGDALVLTRNFEPMDMTAFRNGYLHLWVYVENLSRLNGGQIELSSAGTADSRETSWDLLAYVKKNGWNELYLPISQAVTEGGGADFSAVNFIRLFALSKGSNALGLDYVCMSNDAPPEPSRIDKNNQFVIDPVEAIETWVGSGLYMSRNQPAVGSKWLATDSVDEAGSAVMCRPLTDLDASSYKDGYLHMWLYVEDADLVTGGQIELCSGGEADRQESSWNVGGLSLKDGWNELYLPVSEATQVDGGANIGRLDFIRIYVISSGEQTVGVDYIALSRVAPEREDPVDEDGNYIIDKIQGISPWSGSAYVYNQVNGYADGADWLSASAGSQQDIQFFRNFSPADLTAYQEQGYLHMWFYIDDIANINGGMIELTSSGTVDDAELYWPLSSYVTKSGWNELYLPFSAAFPEGETPADVTKFNCIRVVVMLGANGGNTGIDEIYATNTEPPVEVPEFDGVIDAVTSAEYWEGTNLTYVEQGGFVPFADYLSASDNKAGDLVFFRLFPTINGSAYADGGLQLWIYVENKEDLTGGMVELTSAGAVDNEELWWPVSSYITKDGWNLLYLPFAQAQQQGDKAVDISALDCVRVVLSMGENGGKAGIDEIVLAKAAPGTEKVVIHNGETLNGTWGNDLVLVNENAPVGDAFVKTGSSTACVVCAGLNPVVDIRGYEYTGEIHMWVYVEDVSNVLDGQLELTSSGLSDDAETAWNITPDMLKNGWNELVFKFEDAYLTGTTNYGSVNYMRLYLNFREAASFGMDEIYVGGIKANVTPPVDNTTKEEAIAEATARSVVYAGNENMRAAIAAVLEKAKNGEAVTLVTLGDSITAGAVAPAGKEWASLVRDYLEGLDGNMENGNVTLVNAGIGSTEAVLGVSRVEKDVLTHDPTLVIVDFGTNDYGLPYGAEAYEGIVRKLIAAGVPMVNGNVCPRNGNNIQDAQIPINENYGVPQISFRSAYYEYSINTGIEGLRANDIWSPDSVHPTTAGHKLYADLLINYLQSEILDKNVTPAALNTEMPGAVTKNGFADAVLVENFYNGDKVSVEMNGWTGDYQARIYQLSTEGWQTNTVDSSITFKVNSGYFYMFFALTPQSGDLEVMVDGVVKETINWAYLGTGYMNPYHIVHLGSAGEHTVTLTLKDNANVENDWFGICAVGAANFEGYAEEEQPDGVIDRITGTDGWSGSEFTYETTGGYQADSGWLKSQVTATGDIVYYYTPAALDLSSFSDGYLHIWMYVDDIAHLRTYGGMLEISSSGAVDNQELYWDISSYVTKSGWNELYLPMSEALTQGEDAMDLTKFNCMRIVFMMGESGGAVGIDEIYMVNEKPAEVPEKTVFSEVEEQNGWDSIDGITVVTENAAAGNVWLRTTTEAAYPSIAWWRPAIDVSGYAKDGYFHLWLYVPKAADVVDGYVELTSSNTVDADEIQWPLTEMNLKDGWNELYLPFAEGTRNGNIDFSAVNFVRIYAGLTNAATIGIDRMELTTSIPEPEPEPVEDPYVLDEVNDGSVAWFGAAATDETTGGYTEGATWKKATQTGTGDVVFMRGFDPAHDLSGFSEGYFHIRLYVDDIAHLRTYGGMLEISSSGAVDNQELYWDISSYVTKSGWNDLYLPMSEALTQGEDAMDLASFNCMRIVVMFGESGGVCGIDDLYMTNSIPEPEPEPVEDPYVLDEVNDGSVAWFGAAATDETTGGYTEGATWKKATQTGTGDVVFMRGFDPAHDLSGFSEGYFHIRLYVDDIAHLRTYGGMLEISSSGAVDNQELYWDISSYVTKSGWNDLYLPMSEALTQGEDAMNLASFNCMRIVVMFGESGGVCGIDDLFVTTVKP